MEIVLIHGCLLDERDYRPGASRALAADRASVRLKQRLDPGARAAARV
jgi:hypothetical protein